MDYDKLEAYFLSLDRSLFLEGEYRKLSEMNQPLPIGFGQTISQPTLVLMMTYMLDPDERCRVLEIGTGSGFQTALLSAFSEEVYTVERIPELSEKARRRLDAMGYRNIFYRIGDGSDGWKEHAPYDRIMVTAAASKIPDELLHQLNRGGKMLIPVGPENLQELLLVRKNQDETVEVETVEWVRFVEMKGKYGWNRKE
ncbi:protein-L-isoaspartate(D-aspartate) O-methyltransferase [Proteiniclasticum sp. SCR006]|uniref:Protein-L-isoaspartate O-methyltransferase n=1 Tax=Proteiniclasticum aestuarii TaxID=2817862 RepID=A0A939KGS6_9CLOT|nr:protein-L-isoaspartate(D-aspartate) O-methyltransferase [Proteiniclasticum aestuarii]MBO1265842.1 protein-L-isoaspartate(D-aspartate) O-methyltransferase [Proteiniclasticum aestuarii]